MHMSHAVICNKFQVVYMQESQTVHVTNPPE